MPKQISDGEKTRNIYSRIAENAPLVSYMVEHGGGTCDCVSFLTTSSQVALQEVLSHTHSQPNKDKEAAASLLKGAYEEHRKHFLDTVRNDDNMRTTRHRLPHTRNRVTVEQPVKKPVNYIKRSLGDTSLPPTIASGEKEGRFQNILDALPIEAGKISDTALERLMLMPDDFDSYCGVAKDIYLHATWKKIAHILGEGKTVYRGKNTGRSSRIMQVQTFSGEKRYVVFINQDSIHTHTTPSKTSQHKIQKTSFLVFEEYDELMRSQEHAMQSLKEKMDTYIQWHALFQQCRIRDSSDISVMQDLLGEAVDFFENQKGYHAAKILLTLKKSQTEPTKFISQAIRNLYNALSDIGGKLGEIELVYQNLAKGREKIIMEDVQMMAKIINQ